MKTLDKSALLETLRSRLAEEISTMSRIALEAAAAVSHEDNKPENDKDMRSTEASYLARGQAERARELERGLALLSSMPLRSFSSGERISASALVELESRGATTIGFVLPAGGGQRLQAGSMEVQVITPTSPLGKALMGLSEGDTAEVATPQGVRTYEIVSVL
jgi:transcription elongation GreA/GreB family factor